MAELKLGDRQCRERVAQMQEQHELVSSLAALAGLKLAEIPPASAPECRD